MTFEDVETFIEPLKSCKMIFFILCTQDLMYSYKIHDFFPPPMFQNWLITRGHLLLSWSHKIPNFSPKTKAWGHQLSFCTRKKPNLFPEPTMMPSDFLFPSTNSRKTPKYSRSNYLKQSQKSQSFSLKFLNRCFCFVFLVKSLKQLKRKLSVDRLIS